MLQQLRVRNCGPHEESTIDLSHPVTTIVGPTDAGKSALLAALRWVLANEGSTKELLREGARELVAQVVYDDDQKITRKKTTTANTYRVGALTLAAVGRAGAVPDEVRDALGIDPEVSFQCQHDAAFWLSESPGDRAARFNTVIDLEAIDESQQKITQKVRSATELVNRHDVALSEINVELEQLSWVDEADARLLSIESREVDLYKREQTLAKVEGVIGVIGGLAPIRNRLSQACVRLSRALATKQGIAKRSESAKSVVQVIKNAQDPSPALAALAAIQLRTKQLRDRENRLSRITSALQRVQQASQQVEVHKRDIQRMSVLQAEQKPIQPSVPAVPAVPAASHSTSSICPSCRRPL